jgi:hypothetical protein
MEALLELPVREQLTGDAFDTWEALHDAISEALFADHATVAEREQARFHQILKQLNRYVEDQILVMRRRRGALEERIEESERRRDRSLNPALRTREDEAIRGLRQQVQRLSEQIARLKEGGDPDYQMWRERLMERRFRKPEVRRILDVEFRVADGERGW